MLATLSVLAMSLSGGPLVSDLQEISESTGRWERWTFSIENSDSAERNVRICPRDVVMELHDPAHSKTDAFALSFGEDNWSHSCIETVIGSGQSATFNAYIRPFGQPGLSRTMSLKTADGDYVIPAV